MPTRPPEISGMTTSPSFRNRKSRVLTRVLAAVVYVTLDLLPATTALAQVPCYDAASNLVPCEGAGGTRFNGTRTQPFYIAPGSAAAAGIPQNWFPALSAGFKFEPESPFSSLKSVPIWNELQQLLDNPYLTALCSSLAAQPALIRGTPGNFDGFPSYCTNTAFNRRPTFGGVVLPPLLVHPLNYNPADGEEMRLLNPNYPGGNFNVPDLLYQDLAGDPTGNTWRWTSKPITVSPGSGRVTGPEIDYNGPQAPDPSVCVVNLELVPPEGSFFCGGDPGEPNYAGFGANSATGYSRPAVPRVSASGAGSSPGAALVSTQRLFDATRGGTINARNAGNGTGGLNKPSIAVPAAGGTPNNPNYAVNSAAALGDPLSLTASHVVPSNENDYVRNRTIAAVLGKSFFWDMQVGSDVVQSCGTCHFNGTGTDTRTKNQVNPNHLGGDVTFQIHGGAAPNTFDLVASDFPVHKLNNKDVAGDPACFTPIVATVDNVNAGGIAVLDHPLQAGPVSSMTVCDANNIVSDVNDVVSSMGVHFGRFTDIPAIGTFLPPSNGVASVPPDLRSALASDNTDPIPGFAGVSGHDLRRVEPRNTPTMQAAGFNFDNFWDGRARHDFNGGSVFGDADPQAHVFAASGANLIPTRQSIKFASIASLATGPGLSEFEMSRLGRNWAKVGKKLLQGTVGADAGGSPVIVGAVTPLANQLVDPTDSFLGPYSNQGGSACAGLASQDRSPGVPAAGKPGLCISYPGLIRQAYYPALWQNAIGAHLNGCYTDARPDIHPNQCAAGSVNIPGLDSLGAVVNLGVDPFDGYVLQGPVTGAASAADTNQFRQMEANFSLFWGLSIHMWVQVLIPDNTPFDQFLDINPDAYLALGDTTEPLLVSDLQDCTTPGQRNARLPNDPDASLQFGACFTEFGNFKRDSGLSARIHATGEGGTGATLVPTHGTRTPGSNMPDPLLGMDVFFASNVSLKNPNFRSGRCGACHNMPTLTDHTVPFTFKAQLPDFASESTAANPGVELLVEPIGRNRVISGFLLESEIAETGQDAVERRFINQSLAPEQTTGIAYPDGVFNPGGSVPYYGAGQAFIDNGVYNLGVRPIDNDMGRGGTDAFGWPLSLASLLMKNLGGPDFEPNVPANPITGAPGRGSGNIAGFDPSFGPTGGLWEESAQDQGINPGYTDEPSNPLLPPYLAPFAPGITVGDSQPELDEPFAGINTLTDVAMLEGFIDVIGPVNPRAVRNEAFNNAESELMGTFPVVNRVIRDGAFKAPQLRNVELTGPYFHNGGQLTLRQVVDFYVRGGDFPITNAQHRDFLLTNLDIEAQSNLSEEEKVALVDFLLELTDERNRFDRAPFDHPEVIVAFDGLAPESTGRAALLANPMFKSITQVGSAGQATPEPAFLNVSKLRVSGAEAFPGNSAACPALIPGTSQIVSHYCH